MMPLTDEVLCRNRLLVAAPPAVREQVAARGRLEPLEFKQLLFEEGRRVDRVIFPIVGVCSLLSIAADERIVEVATIGNEGFVGLPVFLQATLMSAHRAIAQIPGEGVVIDAPEFLEISNSGGPFQAVLMRYAQALMTQIAQGAACNRLHNTEQRAARWLLMTHDRVDGDEFLLKQEFLAQMLGTEREAVNEAARALQARGLITYTHDVVCVTDRAGLEQASCECHRIVQGEFDRLLPRAR
jgi:CRP-like cAMP-binding protein